MTTSSKTTTLLHQFLDKQVQCKDVTLRNIATPAES